MTAKDDFSETFTETNSDMIPTKDLLKRRRKADYQKAKAHAKVQRAEAKAKRLEERAEARRARDQELWQSLKPASSLED